MNLVTEFTKFTVKTGFYPMTSDLTVGDYEEGGEVATGGYNRAVIHESHLSATFSAMGNDDDEGEMPCNTGLVHN